MRVEYIELFEVISNFFPIGLSYEDERYKQHSGTRKVHELRNSKFKLTTSSNINGWEKFINSIRKEGKNVEFQTRSHEVCLSGYLAILQENSEFIYTKELCFQVSELGPYFTIYGIDTVIYTKNDHFFPNFYPIITVSPVGDYEKDFLFIRNKIEETYVGYKFIRYSLLGERIKGLEVGGILEHMDDYGVDASIYQALFSTENITKHQCYGDIYYE